MTSRARLDAAERMFVSCLLEAEPALDTAVNWAKRLNKLLQRRAPDDLDEVLAAAAGTLFGKFAASLRRDFEAISAALELPWTTSPVEGQISRIKMLKHDVWPRRLRAPPRTGLERSLKSSSTESAGEPVSLRHQQVHLARMQPEAKFDR